MNMTENLLGAVRAMGRAGSIPLGAVLELRFVPKLTLPNTVVRNAIVACRRRDLEGRV